jgi:uncharacterized RDD family membrane protein YckC
MEPIRDQLNIDTPELVAIELPLAGIGSRFVAALVDSLIAGFGLFVLGMIWVFVVAALESFWKVTANWAIGLFLIVVFVIIWGYYTLFEAFGNGRTPGKRVAKIRVIHQSGRGITFLESLARNLIRYADFFPFFYALGVVTMFMNRRSQRLGDLAAGTLVVRDRESEAPGWSESSTRTITAAAVAAPPPLDAPHLLVLLPAPALAKLTASDLEVLEGFFARRLDMDLATRASLAGRIAQALCVKSGLAVPDGTSVETFLEAAAHQFRELGRMN